MLCNITNQPVVDGVVSNRTGHLFEKKEILKHLKNSSKCPITNEDLTREDLVAIRQPPGKQQGATHGHEIPNILSTLQNEWDTLMIQDFTLKQHIDGISQEMAHTVFQHDSACRVISRLVKEREEAKRTLAEFQQRITTARQQQEAELQAELSVKTSVPESVKKHIGVVSAKLTAQRKKLKKNPLKSTPAAEISRYSQARENKLHKEGSSVASVSISGDLIASGGADGELVVFDKKQADVVARLEAGAGKAITGVRFGNRGGKALCFSGGDDAAVRVWDVEEKVCAATLKQHHRNTISAFTLSPEVDYLLSTSLDGVVVLWDLDTSKSLANFNWAQNDNNPDAGITTSQFHPDGVVFATGTTLAENNILAWDARSMEVVATFSHEGGPTDLDFSPNGVNLATAGLDGKVRVWDMRNQTVSKELTFTDCNPEQPTPVNAVVYDHSGSYLAVGSESVKVLEGKKEYNTILENHVHDGRVNDLAWGEEASWLVSCGADGTVRYWAEEDMEGEPMEE